MFCRFRHAQKTPFHFAFQDAENAENKKRAGRAPTKAELAEYSAMFKLYDTDGSGTLTIDELQEAMMGTSMEPGEIEEMFNSANFDGDMDLDLQEFIAMMSGQTEDEMAEMNESSDQVSESSED